MMDPEFRVPTRYMYGVRMQTPIWQQSSPVETDGEVMLHGISPNQKLSYVYLNQPNPAIYSSRAIKWPRFL